MIERAGDSRTRTRGIALTVEKGLPLSGGQGGSAASAVAGAVAVNALLGSPLDRLALVPRRVEARGERVGPPRRQHRALAARRDRPDPLARASRPGSAAGARRAAGGDGPSRSADADRRMPARCCRLRSPRAAALHQAAQVGAMVAALAVRRLCATRPRHRRPHRRAGARRSPAGVPRGQDGRHWPPARWAAPSREAGPRRLRWSEAPKPDDRVAAAMAAGVLGVRVQERSAGGSRSTVGGRECSTMPAGQGAMRFQTHRPASWQACTACGNEIVGDRSASSLCRTAAACWRFTTGHPPSLRPELIQRFTERRGRRARCHRLRRMALPRDRAPLGRQRSSPIPRATRRCSIGWRWIAGPASSTSCSSTRATTPPGPSRTGV